MYRYSDINCHIWTIVEFSNGDAMSTLKTFQILDQFVHISDAQPKFNLRPRDCFKKKN